MSLVDPEPIGLPVSICFGTTLASAIARTLGLFTGIFSHDLCGLVLLPLVDLEVHLVLLVTCDQSNHSAAQQPCRAGPGVWR